MNLLIVPRLALKALAQNKRSTWKSVL